MEDSHAHLRLHIHICTRVRAHTHARTDPPILGTTCDLGLFRAPRSAVGIFYHIYAFSSNNLYLFLSFNFPYFLPM